VKRGRKSTGELTVLVGGGFRTPPAPPSELTDAQAMVWREVVSTLPGDYIGRGAHAVLVAHCRHVCRGRLLELQLRRFEVEWMNVEDGLERFDRMLAMADRETKAITATARALRLSPQQQMHPRTAGRRVNDWPADARRPWDPD
jgi:hypothetical protein